MGARPSMLAERISSIGGSSIRYLCQRWVHWLTNSTRHVGVFLLPFLLLVPPGSST
jgi:hypothetical protein